MFQKVQLVSDVVLGLNRELSSTDPIIKAKLSSEFDSEKTRLKLE